MEYVYEGMAIHRYDYALFNQIDPYNHTDDVIRWAEQQVRDAVTNARDVKNIDTNVQKYQHWQKVAYDYFCSTAPNKHKNWGLVCAAYGYAIEEYVNLQIQSRSYPYPAEFGVSTQHRVGGTIPDIVITIHYTDSAGTAMTTEAWLDITSERSVSHIYGKRGSGWRNKPIVIELAYPPLNASQLTF